MAFPPWAKGNEKDLARYALAAVGDEIKLATPTADLLSEGNRAKVIRELYEALCAKDIRWARERYNPDLAVQEIRTPDTILNGSGDGTCLDLALLFAGVALGKDLLPLVVVLEGHALVAVSQTTAADKSGGGARRRDDGDWVSTGILSRAGAADELRKLVAAGRYVLVECTGFARTPDDLAPETPEGRGRHDGLLSYERAVQAGVEQLAFAARPFAFAVDIAYLQNVMGLRTYAQGGGGFDEVEPDLRKRLDCVLADHRLVAGRNAELAVLDRFVAETASGYSLVTGAPGMGKTALLAEWTRRLTSRNDVRVVYYFLSRQQGTADRQHDFMQTILQQARWAWGQRGPSQGSIAELESSWLEILDVQNPPPQPVVVVVDGVDEAAPWRVPKSFLPDRLPSGVHVVLSARKRAGTDWRQELGVAFAESIDLEKLDDSAVAAIVRRAQAPDWLLAEDAFAVLTERVQGDPFYLRLLCDKVIDGEIRSKGELAGHATGLDKYIDVWWNEELSKSASEPAVRCLLSYLTVALAPITRGELIDIDAADALDGFAFVDALDKISRYVTGDVSDVGMSLAHWRLQEYIGRVVLGSQRAAVTDKLVAWCDRWPDHYFRYALAKGFTHHLDAFASVPASGKQQARSQLVGLLGDPAYQSARAEKASDTAGLIADFDRLVSTLAAEPEVAVEDLVEASMQLSRARVQWLRPEFVFELARRGKFDEAIDRMAILSSGGSWRTAATVCVAWMAALQGCPEVATRLLPDVVQDGPPLGVLGARVRSAIDPSVPPPELVYSYGHNTLDDWSSIKMAAEVIERFGSSSAEGVVYSGLAALRESRRSAPSYGTELDAPVVVAAARDVGEGDALLEEYIGLHSANPYASYRDRSLWVILGAVACLPDAHQALRHVIRLCEGAFAPSPVRFVEALYLSVLANRPGQAPRLTAMRRNAVGDARELRRQYSLYSRGSGVAERPSDTWSFHRRRLSAHAEADVARASALLDTAVGLPDGFAGYQAPASLALAESNFVVRPADVDARAICLDAALTAAHNVQDPSFCARTTAYVNAIRLSWDQPPTDIAATVGRFVSGSRSSEFSAVHVVGETFDRRDRSNHLEIDDVTRAVTLEQLAYKIFQLPVGRFEVVNPGSSRGALLAPGSLVRVPDPAFAPLVATWLSAQVVGSNLAANEKTALIARLVPAVRTDATLLDTVLARLVAVTHAGLDLDRIESSGLLIQTTDLSGALEFEFY